MFCKPPCPDELDLALVSDSSDDRAAPRPLAPIGSHDAFGRLIAPETAGPKRRLPPASVRTG
ncbi:hypothetical protein ABIF63_004304 [Bradyrhizobium japonicum]|uniref:Lytic murein transglycosylase n=1 Tax=Bradyrhizobium japonicum TaxID=375 RepID=A0ABV2RTE3_BRAJP